MTLLFSILISGLTLAQDKSVIVVELFTSEGCSSCPPADRLLSELVNASNEEVEVIGLSFHVDYWDYIGWKDPYASRDFTNRQRTYAKRFISNTIYTPQMVVNGKHEFVGSSRDKWNRAYDKEKDKSFTQLDISSLSFAEGKLMLDVSSSATHRSVLNVAVVERGLTQKVTRGENSGRELAHDNVVRAFTARQFDGRKNHFELELPQDLNMQNSSLVVYSQNQNTWYVNAAQKIDLASIQ